MSLDSFVPQDQPAKLKLIAQGAKVLNPALNPDQIDAPPTDQENVDALKSSVDSLRKTAGDAKGRAPTPRGGWPMSWSKLADAERGHPEQGAGRLHRAAEDHDRAAQDCAAGATGHPEDVAAGSGEAVEDQGRHHARRSAAARRSGRQRHAAQFCQRRARGRAERDRRTGIDSQIRRHRREGVHPRRHLGADRRSACCSGWHCGGLPTCC